jgi:hypothetical protein
MHLRLALVLSLLAARSPSDVEVTLRDDRVVVRTVAAPLAEILSRFAQATGAQVVYESARPRQLVSVVIEAGSAAEAIAQLLEGQGLNYALRLDPTGKNVEMLVITGSTSPPAASAAGAARPRPGPPAVRPPEEVNEAEPAEFDQPTAPEVPEVPEPSAPPATSPGDAMSPAMGVPWPGAVLGAPPGLGSSSPGSMSGAPMTSGSPAPEPGQPQVPGAASYPGMGPQLPPQPVFPGPASY